MILDNRDSFTWSLAQYLQRLGASVSVLRAPEAEDAARQGTWSARVISPGPRRPEDHPLAMAWVRDPALPTFGVCLGMQAIGLAYGGRVVRARAPIHGWASEIHHAGQGCFEGLPSPFRAIRYNSLVVVDPGPELEVTAWTSDGEIMGLRHRSLPLEGVQFHPESVGSEHGLAILGRGARLPTSRL